MGPGSISLATEDGASNNKASAKILGVPFKVCCPHDLQRSVLFAAGEAGKTSKNPELKKFIARASSMAAAPHRSTKTSDLLQKSQVSRGTAKSRVVTTETKNVTRWTGLYRMANKARARRLVPTPPRLARLPAPPPLEDHPYHFHSLSLGSECLLRVAESAAREGPRHLAHRVR